MNDEPQLQAVKEAVLQFGQAWTAWEEQMAKGNDSLHDPAMRQAHATLVARFCTAKKRAYVDGLPTYGIPPTYGDVIAENIVNAELCASNKAHVDVRCARMCYRFVVQRKRDGWRIDSIKWRVGDNDGWTNGLVGM